MIISVTQDSLPLAEQLSDGFCITDFPSHLSMHLPSEAKLPSLLRPTVSLLT